jgi:hypothetical protein
VSVEKTPERAAAGFDPSLAQFCNRFYQGQVRPPLEEFAVEILDLIAQRSQAMFVRLLRRFREERIVP